MESSLLVLPIPFQQNTVTPTSDSSKGTLTFNPYPNPTQKRKWSTAANAPSAVPRSRNINFADEPQSDGDMDEDTESHLGDPLDEAVAAVHADIQKLAADLKEVKAAAFFSAQSLQALLTNLRVPLKAPNPPK